jgi:REP element-mobilizing transposase RayT
MTVFSAKCHLVWYPKYRGKLFVGRVAVRLREVVGGVCDELGAGCSGLR